MTRVSSRPSTNTTYGRALTLGFVAGLRSQMPSFLLAVAANRGHFAATAPPPLGWLRSRLALVALTLAEAGEIVADKTPLVPSRLQPGPLGGRIVLGGFSGGVVARECAAAAAVGAALGAFGAAAGSFAGFHGRAALGRLTGLPDPIIAVGEDALALALGLLALPGGPRTGGVDQGVLGSLRPRRVAAPAASVRRANAPPAT